MAQTIKFRRGPLASVANAGVQIGEILIGTGSMQTLDGPVLFIAASNGVGTSSPVSKIFDGDTPPSIGSTSIVTGLPFYSRSNNTLYRLNFLGNEALDLTGNIANRIITGSLTISTDLNVVQNLTASNITASDAKFASASGSFSGSFHGDGSDLSGIVTRLYLSASADVANQNSSTEIDLKTETLTISGSYNQGLYSNLTTNTLNLSLAQAILTSSSPTFVGATFTGNVTASSLSASNLVQANTVKVNSSTLATNYTDGALNVVGGVGIGGNLFVSGAVVFFGDLTLYGSGSHLIITSSEVVIEDNILRLNGYAPYLRYAGVEVIDSGSEVTASFLWDGQNDYWLTISSSGQSSKVIGTTFSTFGGETSLTTNTVPKATANNTIGDSLLTDNGTTLSYIGTGGLSVSNITASVVSASTSVITGDVSSSTVNATTSVTTPNVYASYISASTNIITDRLYAVSSVTSSTVSASTNIITDRLYAVSSITSSVISASSKLITNQITASSVSASTNILTDRLYAVSSVTSSVVSASTNVITDTAYAVSSITSSIISASSYVTTNNVTASIVSASNKVITDAIYAVSSVTSSVVSASTSVITDRLYASSSITSSIISASTKLIAGEITSSALTASTFVFTNASQALQSIAMTDMSGSYLADLYLAWNSGSNVFFATSLIDGGQF